MPNHPKEFEVISENISASFTRSATALANRTWSWVNWTKYRANWPPAITAQQVLATDSAPIAQGTPCPTTRSLPTDTSPINSESGSNIIVLATTAGIASFSAP